MKPSHEAPRMPPGSRSPLVLSRTAARRFWLHAQRLDEAEPFGDGPDATRKAVEHLGYLQIDTINVIERCHHHILWSRIPGYRREHLRQAQTVDKSVFEYWTHALSYVPTRDLRFFLPDMTRHRRSPAGWFDSVSKQDLRKVLTLIRRDGALSIRDILDDVLVEKDHPWASRKPSRRALQLAFFRGEITVSERSGMLKTYELMDRHFGWSARPKPASERQVVDYLVARALRSQGLVSLDSICHLDAKRKSTVREAIAARIRRGLLIPVALEGAERIEHWAEPEALRAIPSRDHEGIHILSPFDPLIIQRKRLKLFFEYEHRFEAYIPKAKRVMGYFALPVLADGEIVAAIDVKADREREALRIRQWTWIAEDAKRHKARIETALHRFERFQVKYAGEATSIFEEARRRDDPAGLPDWPRGG
jgi:hypothetical protein